LITAVRRESNVKFAVSPLAVVLETPTQKYMMLITVEISKYKLKKQHISSWMIMMVLEPYGNAFKYLNGFVSAIIIMFNV